MEEHFTINKRLISGVLTKYRTTFDAFCELLNNAIQANARTVDITIDTAILGETADSNFRSIVVRDDGVGVPGRDFKSKILDIATESKKALGGKGVGRFAALQLGAQMEIETCGRDPISKKLDRSHLIVDTKVWGGAEPLDKIPLEFRQDSPADARDTYYRVSIKDFYPPSVTVEDKHRRMAKLFNDSAIERAIFERYSDIILRGTVVFNVNGKAIHAKDHAIGDIETRTTLFTLKDGKTFELDLQLLQVASEETRHKIFLRVQNANTPIVAHSYEYFGDIPAGNQWIVFVDSAFFGSDADGLHSLMLSDLNPDTPVVVEAIQSGVDAFFKEKYSTYYNFTTRLQGDAAYPYRKIQASSLTRISVFNQLAYHIEQQHQLLKRSSELRNLVYGLVDKSLNLREMSEIVSKVIKVDNRSAERFSTLLQQADLEDVVAFCDEVKTKRQFLDFLYKLNYDEIAGHVSERSQLHKIVQRNLWLFGEQYADSPILFSDKNLYNNLEALRTELLKFEPSPEDDNVDHTITGKALEITDLFFFNERIISGTEREVMIVELKAPRVRLSPKELTQANRYALKIQQWGKISDDISFKIVLIGSDVSPLLRAEFGQRDAKRPSLVGKQESPKRIEVFAVKWADLIEEKRRQLTYLGKHLTTKDREVQEYWTAEFGDVPMKEIFSTMKEPAEQKPKKGRRRNKK